jgi:hypothetical protein
MNLDAANPMTMEREHKIDSRHLERLAMVYVLQSTLEQVQRHRESTQAQYELAGLTHKMGWPSDRVVVIDEDLGQSGASADGRLGFQRLLSEVPTRGHGQNLCGPPAHSTVHVFLVFLASSLRP